MAKIVLSRKGVDSSAGGKPSPWIDGMPLSLPIPQNGSGIRYRNIHTPLGIRANTLMRHLGFRCPGEAHLDPDLTWGSLAERPSGWRPSFGQRGAALSHLMHHNIGPGDLFLFFGWFREVVKKGRQWHYLPKVEDVHLVYAYLEVGEVIDLTRESAPVWAALHPHAVFQDMWQQGGNVLFVAVKESQWLPGWPGAGYFSPSPLILTDLSAERVTRSQWALPDCFFKGENCRLSYHEKRIGKPHPTRKGMRQLRSVARGQEFVIEADKQLMNWWCHHLRANLPSEKPGPEAS
ncbi:MAG: hypothetical protein AAF206_20360 [Bacteroidota bacterium]